MSGQKVAVLTTLEVHVGQNLNKSQSFCSSNVLSGGIVLNLYVYYWSKIHIWAYYIYVYIYCILTQSLHHFSNEQQKKKIKSNVYEN